MWFYKIKKYVIYWTYRWISFIIYKNDYDRCMTLTTNVFKSSSVPYILNLFILLLSLVHYFKETPHVPKY